MTKPGFTTYKSTPLKKHSPFSLKTLCAGIVISLFPPAVMVAAEPSALKEEVQKAIGSGVAWLNRNQDAKTGAWGNPDQPALTAMAVLAIMGDPAAGKTAAQAAPVVKAYAFIRAQAKPDGGIYGKGLAVYNTALCLNSLLLDTTGQSLVLAPGARRFLQNHRSGFDVRVESGDADESDSGESAAQQNLSNTLDSLRQLEAGTKKDQSNGEDAAGLDLEAAIKFVERCQKPSGTDSGGLPRRDLKNAGGAADNTANKKPAKDPALDGRVPLRASGSMTYDSLLSLIYAPMEGDDPRIEAFLGWLRGNYSIEENPGLGTQGLFYYYHSIAKVLSLRKIDRLKLIDGTEIDWRRDLAKRILAVQREDGSWVNANGRWWENDPALVTSYALLTLEQLAKGL